MCDGTSGTIYTVQGRPTSKTLDRQCRTQVGKVGQNCFSDIVTNDASVGLKQVLTRRYNRRYETARVSSSELWSLVMTSICSCCALVAVKTPGRTWRLIKWTATKGRFRTVNNSSQIHAILEVVTAVVVRHDEWFFLWNAVLNESSWQTHKPWWSQATIPIAALTLPLHSIFVGQLPMQSSSWVQEKNRLGIFAIVGYAELSQKVLPIDLIDHQTTCTYQKISRFVFGNLPSKDERRAGHPREKMRQRSCRFAVDSLRINFSVH